MARIVRCVKLEQDLEGLDFNPFPNTELGQRIFDHVSKQAWQLWIRQSVMLINEYRLNLATKEAQAIYDQHLEKFFFGEGAEPPPGYRPPADDTK
ncbi:MAG: oxidative damage protection protein [candidate division Zixibacteria bacterium]|nr:oxidative damage protection protein [candidate division Zixibacteria bacterium]